MSKSKNNKKSKKSFNEGIIGKTSNSIKITDRVFKKEICHLPGEVSEENCIGLIKSIKNGYGFIEREQGKLPDVYSNLICHTMKVGDVVKFDIIINENGREMGVDLICLSKESYPA